MHARVALHFAYERPVGIAFVHLAARASVYGKFPDTAVLQCFGERDDEVLRLAGVSHPLYPEWIDTRQQVIVIPSEARLGGNGRMYGIDNRARYL